MADAVGAVGVALCIPSGVSSKPMSWRLSACMATRRPCRCWRKARPTPAGSGSTFATTSRSAAPGRPRRLPLPARRRGEHRRAHLAGYAGILQADAYDVDNKLDLAESKPGLIREAARWVHARRPFFAMADIEQNARLKAAGKKEIPRSPIALEVVRRIDAPFAIERSINGKSPEKRPAVRRAVSRPVDDLITYMREQGARLSRGTTSPRLSSTCSSAGRPSRCSR